MRTVLALATLGAVLIVLGVIAHGAVAWVNARRQRTEVLPPPSPPPRKSAARLRVHAVGDDHV